MAHYIGPKGRVNRRLGVAVYENAGARRALARRESPPGMHPRPRKVSDYGLAMIEKQKLKHYYGLGERPLRRLFALARRQPGNTGNGLLMLCERRLDNVLRRAGLAKTRPQARQGITHGHFQVNGNKVHSPSYLLRPGDVIDVKNREALRNFYASTSHEAETEVPNWINCDTEHLRVTVHALPEEGDYSAPVNVALVVELLSR